MPKLHKSQLLNMLALFLSRILKYLRGSDKEKWLEYVAPHML